MTTRRKQLRERVARNRKRRQLLLSTGKLAASPSHRFMSREGWPISFKQWVRYTEHPYYWKVARTRVGDQWVSTVWTGRPSRECIFETAIKHSDKTIEVIRRYSTEALAQLGHAETVQQLAARS